MGEVKIEFQENNNGLRFFAQTVVLYGNIFLCVSLSNDDVFLFKMIADSHFEMILIDLLLIYARFMIGKTIVLK